MNGPAGSFYAPIPFDEPAPTPDQADAATRYVRRACPDDARDLLEALGLVTVNLPRPANRGAWGEVKYR